MRRGVFVFLLTTGMSLSSIAQLKIDNATFFISAGTTVTVQGDITSNVDIQGTGLVLLKGTTLQHIDMGGNTIPTLELDNTANAVLQNSNTRVGLGMTLTNGRFQLGDHNLVIAAGAPAITGAGATRFIETNGNGVLTKEALNTAFVYPVGYGAGEFNPVTITNTGTADAINVRCLQQVLTNGTSGTPVTAHFANNSWLITEAVAGGSNLSVTGEWNSSDELPGFNRLKSGIARYNTGTDWDLPASNVLAAAGSGPYSRSRSSITQPGVFAVADLGKVNTALLDIRIFLQGPSFSGGLMNDNLRQLNLIPSTQPYSAALSASRFNRVGVYDGSASVNESVPSTSVFDVTGTTDDIVDWVYLSLLDPASPSVKLQTRAALLKRNGSIVEYDPATSSYGPVRMPIDADGNYHLLIGHRNHLSVRTPVVNLLQDNVTFTYDFTTSQSQAFGLNPMAGFSGVFGLISGNVDYSNVTRASGPPGINDDTKLLTRLGTTSGIFSSVYEPFDLNMDGTTRASGPPAINDRTKLFNILGVISTIITEQL